MQVLENFGLWLLDFPIIIMLIFMYGTLWRSIALSRKIKAYKDGDFEHKIVCLQFIEWIFDIPFVPFFLFLCIFIWRIPTYYKMWSGITNWERRFSLVLLIFVALVDFFCL